VTDRLYHLALSTEWAEALEAGEYRRSTRGLGLDEVGFVHLAFAHQLADVRARWFAGAAAVTVVEVDPDPIDAELRIEGGFPHLYGPLPLDAVTGYWPWPFE
jgi:glutathione S-transferase